jgi:predicted HTH domain antitoxin
MQIHLEIPSSLPDALQRTPQEFVQEAKMAMAVKLYEMKRLSSGMAATLAGVSRVAFIWELHRYGVPVIDLSVDDLESDVANA